jgi:hypothetical protein
VVRYAVFSAATVRLLFFDSGVNIFTYTPVFNERVLAFAVAIAALYVSGWLLSRQKALPDVMEQPMAVPAMFIAANFFTLFVLTAEVLNVYDRALRGLSPADLRDQSGVALRNLQNLSVTGLWAIYGVGVLVLGVLRRIRDLRLAALVVLLAAIVKVFVDDVFKLAIVYRIVAFTGLGLLLPAAAYFYQRYRKSITSFLKE